MPLFRSKAPEKRVSVLSGDANDSSSQSPAMKKPVLMRAHSHAITDIVLDPKAKFAWTVSKDGNITVSVSITSSPLSN